MKKLNFKYDGYDEYLYTGIQGFVIRKIPSKLNNKILEIGRGAKPHCSVVKLNGVEEYWVSDNRNILDSAIEKSNHNIKKFTILMITLITTISRCQVSYLQGLSQVMFGNILITLRKHC